MMAAPAYAIGPTVSQTILLVRLSYMHIYPGTNYNCCCHMCRESQETFGHAGAKHVAVYPAHWPSLMFHGVCVC